MRKLVLFFILIFTFINIKAQELNCTITVNHDQVRGSDDQIFKTLEKSINDYLNNTKWTDKQYKKQEKIQCAITLNITERPENNTFKGSLQIQVLRPVFNSTYLTPVLNFNDDNLSFNYEEFQPLIYNENIFESNLTSILTFYAYVILGVDEDTFAYNGGDQYFKKAENAMLVAQQSGYKGWKRIDGNTTRYQFIENMLNNTFKDYRLVMYRYHRNGLDVMFDDKDKAKKTIGEAITNLQRIYSKRPRAYLLRVFLDTKEDEIVSIFKEGPQIDTRGLQEMLLRVYPARNDSWKEIK
ncbi:MAG: DUF4835 family protein [Flavobacteriaceae bacterium]|nr:DUF4835 family protein [Flavobacteriaceae bacterium]